MFDDKVCVAFVKGNIASHRTICKDACLVQNVTFSKVNNDIKIEMTLNRVLPNGVYTYDFDIICNFTSGFNIYMYGEHGGNNFNAKTMYRYWEA